MDLKMLIPIIQLVLFLILFVNQSPLSLVLLNGIIEKLFAE
ncbi:MAG: hypothetical protein STSR0008_23200 [Ignavibacterium sp.]